jgi:hypothetical protein
VPAEAEPAAPPDVEPAAVDPVDVDAVDEEPVDVDPGVAAGPPSAPVEPEPFFLAAARESVR